MRRDLTLGLACAPLVLAWSAAAQTQAGEPAAPGASASPTGQLPTAVPEPQPPPPPGASTAPPAAAPAPAATPGYYPPQAYYPPGGYYPPPGYYYSPGGYYPPPGYAAPGYWAPPPRVRPRYPDDASTQTSPFVDLLASGIMWEDRFDDFFTLGVQAGMYAATRIRIAARLQLFLSSPGDNLADYYADGVPDGFAAVPSDSPNLVFTGSLGAAPVVRSNFVFAPGIAVARSDVSDYGTFVGMSLPFEWVTDDGARFGFEIDIGRALGGRHTVRCDYAGAGCTPGEERELDRPAAAAFYGAFQFGWGFNHPAPKNSAE